MKDTSSSLDMTRPPIKLPQLENCRPTVPSLHSLCIKEIWKGNLTEMEGIERKLPARVVKEVIDNADLTIPLEQAARLIACDRYWKRRTRSQYKPHHLQVEYHAHSWKQLCLQLATQELLENLPPNPTAETVSACVATLDVFRPYIFQLELKEYPAHYDVGKLLHNLPCLCRLRLFFGEKYYTGQKYNSTSLMGMRIEDATGLARLCRVSQTLIQLELPNNFIDDELVNHLMGGLYWAVHLTDLDLSHNKIGDHGVQKIVRLLEPKFCLNSLDLHDNCLHARSGMELGAAIVANQTLLSLNVRLNHLQDLGVSHLLQDIGTCSTLKVFDVACNGLTYRSISNLTSFLAEYPFIESVDVSGNNFFYPTYYWRQNEGRQHQWCADDSRMLHAPLIMDSGPDFKPDNIQANQYLVEETNTTIISSSVEQRVVALIDVVKEHPCLQFFGLRQCHLPNHWVDELTTSVNARRVKAINIESTAWQKVINNVSKETPPQEPSGAATTALSATTLRNGIPRTSTTTDSCSQAR